MFWMCSGGSIVTSPVSHMTSNFVFVSCVTFVTSNVHLNKIRQHGSMVDWSSTEEIGISCARTDLWPPSPDAHSETRLRRQSMTNRIRAYTCST
jgi:hypothetical protein